MEPESFAISIIILLLSVIIHEVMHGYAALQFGDHTAEYAGRLTLNPIPHIDPIGTILLPALLILPAVFSGTYPSFIFGWAKPVPVNPLHFSDIKKGELVVSAAGILINLAIAIIASLIYHLTSSISMPLIVNDVLRFTININLLLAVFNLLPIPPLDGSKILISQLPYTLAREFQKLEQYGFIILFALLLLPIGQTTALSFILSICITFLKSLLGLNF